MTSKVLVVGSGAIGLRTALELLRQNIPIKLRSAHPPLHPSTCSSGAGGLWMPFHCDDIRTGFWAMETLQELICCAKRRPIMEEEKAAVEILPVVVLHRNHHGPSIQHFLASNFKEGNERHIATPLPPWTSYPELTFQHLTVEMLHWQNQAIFKMRIPPMEELKQAGYNHAWLFRAPVVDPTIMLMHMLTQIQTHPLTEDINTDTHYQSLGEMVQEASDMGCNAVVNCTGMGSASMSDARDKLLVGARGDLVHYSRSCPRRTDGIRADDGNINDAVILTEDEPWGTKTHPAYMIPRGGVFVVGGTYLEGDTGRGLRKEERERLIQNAWRFGVDTTRSPTLGEWTGLRPYRPQVRLEVDYEFGSAVKLIHNYGHGGSGWTVFVGTARDAAKLLKS